MTRKQRLKSVGLCLYTQNSDILNQSFLDILDRYVNHKHITTKITPEILVIYLADMIAHSSRSPHSVYNTLDNSKLYRKLLPSEQQFIKDMYTRFITEEENHF